MQIFGAIIYVFIWNKIIFWSYLAFKQPIFSSLSVLPTLLTFNAKIFSFEMLVELATLFSFELFTYGTETWVIWKSPIWVLGIWKRWWKDHFVRWWYKQWISLADCNGICWWRCPWLFILRGILKFIFLFRNAEYSISISVYLRILWRYRLIMAIMLFANSMISHNDDNHIQSNETRS